MKEYKSNGPWQGHPNSGGGARHRVNMFSPSISAVGPGHVQARWTAAGTLGVTVSSCSLPHSQVPRARVDRQTQIRESFGVPSIST